MRSARQNKISTSAILEVVAREELQKIRTDAAGDEVQRTLQNKVASCLGVLTGGSPRRAKTAREQIRKRLSKRQAG